MKKVIIIGFLIVLFASFAQGAITFYDDFNRADNPVVGNGWTETNAAWAITDKTLKSSAARATMNQANVSHDNVCFQFNSTTNMHKMTIDYQYDDTHTMRLFWNTATNPQYYTGAIYTNCGDTFTMANAEWICYNTTSPYTVYHANDTTEMREMCNISTTYDAGHATYAIMMDNGANAPVSQWDQVCGADTLNECIGGAAAPAPPANISDPYVTVETPVYGYEHTNQSLSIVLEYFNITNVTDANLTFNTTTYPATINWVNSSFVNFTANNVIPPLVLTNTTNQPFTWNVGLNYENATTGTYTNDSESQNIAYGYFNFNFNSQDVTEEETANINFSYLNPGLANLSFSLEFLSINYTASTQGTTAYRDFLMPQSSQQVTNYNFTGSMNITYQGEEFIRKISGNNTVYQFLLTNCTDGNITVTFWTNEENDLYWLEVDTIDVDFEYYNPNGNLSNVKTLGASFFNTVNASICLYPYSETLVTNAYIINTKDTGYSHRYYLVNANLTNETSDIYLYNFNNTDNKNTLTVNIVDEFYNPLPNIVVKLLRYYPAGTHANTGVSYAHTWQTVQVDRSDEFGETAFHVSDSGDTDYYFIMESNNTIVKQTATMKLLCPDPANCEATFQIDSQQEAQNPFQLFDDYTWDYDAASEVVTVNWSDTTLLTQEIQFEVAQQKADGYLTICSQTYNTPSGSFECNTTGYDGIIRVSGYRTASPLAKFLSELIDKSTAAFGTVLNGEGALWGALIMVAIVLAAATSAAGVIVMSMVGLIILFLTGITNIVTVTFLVLGIIVGLIIAIKLKR